MLDIKSKLNNTENSVKEFLDSIRLGVPTAVFGVPDSFKNFLASLIDSPVLFVARDNLSAHITAKAVKEFSDKDSVYIPPKDETLTLMRAFSKDTLFDRLLALSGIKNSNFIIVTPQALTQLYPKNLMLLTLEKDKDFNLETAVSKLVKMGYQKVESVESKGTFSRRGDVIDVYPVNKDNAYRIDFFGDTVDNIKKFDIETRKNIGFEKSLNIVQALEYVFEDNETESFFKFVDREIKDSNGEKRARLSDLREQLLDASANNDKDALSYFACLSQSSCTIFDLLPKDTVVIFDEAKKADEIISLCETEFTERFKSLDKEGNVFAFSKKNFINKEYITERLKNYRRISLQALSTAVPFFSPLKIINPKVSGIANYRLDFKEIFTDTGNWLKSGYNIIITTGNTKRAEMLSGDFSSQGIASSIDKPLQGVGVEILSSTLTCGFIFHETKIAVVGSGNLYSSNDAQRKIRKNNKAGFFSAPEVGDYCVHETHGIGKVLGSKKISSTESTKDYIAVEYSGGDILYIPVEQLDLLTRYLGAEKHPKLSKIGGADFEKIKRSVKESIKKMSFDLKRLYSERQALKGYAFDVDSESEKAFDDAFPYEETPDQLISEKDIKKDMSSGKVMDRLICGDVGFGKTEVAFRAVFRAVSNGKQAALLAPTTILTEQHYNTAVNRFKGFGVKIACLNRFRTAKEQDKIISDLKAGKIDFIIGTHRLLSKDVGFYDLGLLVLDEEQRFGVEHKEKIKLLKTNVDTLTLTATPIPRTLHMSLTGIREISIINTPPKKRLPVQTYVTEETDMLIKDAVSREINRGGQAFILYNRVESINTFSERVKALLPDLKITVVHGQMEEKTMERSILDFYEGKSDVLISTTIIENGIDLPKANTLIVIDADRLGLSTLYQLKGRVGRSDRLAYAYFTFKREKILNNTAFERLNAIIEFTEMGSGIKIAMRDLEIRGAGNILGAEQHGHMDKIGYELYSKLLREELTGEVENVPELDVRINAYIPEKYIEGNSARMDAYKEIAEINSREAEKEFIERTRDNYGELPQEVINLINIAVVKSLAGKLNVSEIVIEKERVYFAFSDFKNFFSSNLIDKVEKSNGFAYVSMTDKARIEFLRTGGESNSEMLCKMREFIEEG